MVSYRLFIWWRHCQLRNGANQFFILIYNLVIADIQQAMAFALTAFYLAEDKIEVGTTTCFANGWFVSTGDLASGVFILNIGLHTFLTIVKGQTISDMSFYLWLAGSWAFVYFMAILTVAMHKNVYVRAGAWCWIDKRYDKERLWLHYIWIFIAMFGVVVIYAMIYFFIKARLTGKTRTNINTTSDNRAELANARRAAKYMIIYPVVYVVCTLPLAGGRMAAMSGVLVPPYWWYCFAGAAITSCGWLDVVLYAITRHVLVFPRSAPPKTNLGLNTFGWHPTPPFYGVTTTVEAPLSRAARRHESKTSILSPVWRPLRRRQSDEDYFANVPEGVIMTKTTIEVTSIPAPHHSLTNDAYARSETSVLEIDDKAAIVTPSGSVSR
ncbi:hypothetical protein LTR64_007808 [Lithohypha guttulata]|uniref:uncharacterized protein n=1 Tax=Lithohypha guttulata TaxID=1690604 RepID=UPI00315DB23B